MELNTYLGYNAIIRQCQVFFPRMKTEKKGRSVFKILSYKMEDSVLEEKLIVWYFPSLGGHLISGLLLVVFKWFSKASQSEKGCFSLSFTEYIKHTA